MKRTILVLTISLVLTAIMTGCVGENAGFSTTNIVGYIDGDRICLDRLDRKVDAKDVRCFPPGEVDIEDSLRVGDCVVAERRSESARVVRIHRAPESKCAAISVRFETSPGEGSNE